MAHDDPELRTIDRTVSFRSRVCRNIVTLGSYVEYMVPLAAQPEEISHAINEITRSQSVTRRRDGGVDRRLRLLRCRLRLGDEGAISRVPNLARDVSSPYVYVNRINGDSFGNAE